MNYCNAFTHRENLPHDAAAIIRISVLSCLLSNAKAERRSCFHFSRGHDKNQHFRVCKEVSAVKMSQIFDRVLQLDWNSWVSTHLEKWSWCTNRSPVGFIHDECQNVPLVCRQRPFSNLLLWKDIVTHGFVLLSTKFGFVFMVAFWY